MVPHHPMAHPKRGNRSLKKCHPALNGAVIFAQTAAMGLKIGANGANKRDKSAVNGAVLSDIHCRTNCIFWERAFNVSRIIEVQNRAGEGTKKIIRHAAKALKTTVKIRGFVVFSY